MRKELRLCLARKELRLCLARKEHRLGMGVFVVLQIRVYFPPVAYDPNRYRSGFRLEDQHLKHLMPMKQTPGKYGHTKKPVLNK